MGWKDQFQKWQQRQAKKRAAISRYPKRANPKCECSHCGHRERITAQTLSNAGRQRCPQCGGPMNRLREA